MTLDELLDQPRKCVPFDANDPECVRQLLPNIEDSCVHTLDRMHEAAYRPEVDAYAVWEFSLFYEPQSGTEYVFLDAGVRRSEGVVHFFTILFRPGDNPAEAAKAAAEKLVAFISKETQHGQT